MYMAFVYHDHEGFRPARRSRKQRRPPLSIQDLVLRAREEVTANGDWLFDCRGLIRDCAEPGSGYKVMCLGLGSLSELSNARVQLVFLQLVLQHVLDVTDDNVTIFDPAFTPGDASYLRDHAGYAVLSAEPENYATSSDTVAYMPHCELSLFEQFLKDNWFRERIPSLILVGNTLSDYADNIPSHKLSAVYPCVAKLVPLLKSRPIPRSDLICSAFSSISVQRVRASAVPPQDDVSFWGIQSQDDAKPYQKGGSPRGGEERDRGTTREDAK